MYASKSTLDDDYSSLTGKLESCIKFRLQADKGISCLRQMLINNMALLLKFPRALKSTCF